MRREIKIAKSLVGKIFVYKKLLQYLDMKCPNLKFTEDVLMKGRLISKTYNVAVYYTQLKDSKVRVDDVNEIYDKDKEATNDIYAEAKEQPMRGLSDMLALHTKFSEYVEFDDRDKYEILAAHRKNDVERFAGLLPLIGEKEVIRYYAALSHKFTFNRYDQLKILSFAIMRGGSAFDYIVSVYDSNPSVYIQDINDMLEDETIDGPIELILRLSKTYTVLKKNLEENTLEKIISAAYAGNISKEMQYTMNIIMSGQSVFKRSDYSKENWLQIAFLYGTKKGCQKTNIQFPDNDMEKTKQLVQAICEYPFYALRTYNVAALQYIRNTFINCNMNALSDTIFSRYAEDEDTVKAIDSLLHGGIDNCVSEFNAVSNTYNFSSLNKKVKDIIEDDKEAYYSVIITYLVMAIERMRLHLYGNRELMTELVNSKYIEKEDVHKDEKIKKLETELEAANAKVNEKQKTINELQLQVERLQKQLAAYETSNAHAETVSADIEPMDDDSTNEYADNNRSNDDSYNIPAGSVLVGGHYKWQNKFLQAYPFVKAIGPRENSFSKNIINEKTPLVIINTNYMRHSVFDKLMPLLKRYNIPYKYRTKI